MVGLPRQSQPKPRQKPPCHSIVLHYKICQIDSQDCGLFCVVDLQRESCDTDTCNNKAEEDN